MTDALSRAALHRAVSLSAEIEVQLYAKEGSRPIVALLSKAQDAAAEAIVALADVDAEDPTAIRKLQNDIVCYDRILEWLKEIVAEGVDAGALLDDDSREDIAAVLGLDGEDGTDIAPTEDRQ
jgi:hypothetical protein